MPDMTDVAIKVEEGVSPQWASVVGNDVPVLASAPWISATSHRLTQRRVTFFATSRAGVSRPQAGGLQAAVVDDPMAYETHNLYRMLLGDPMVFKFPPTAVAARAPLRARAEPAEHWFPNLAVLYPGYDCFVAGGESDRSLTRSLVDQVLAWSASQGMRAVSFQYVRAGTVLAEVLAERGLRRLPLTFRATLEVSGDFSEYLTRLPRRRGREVMRERRRLREAGVRTVRCEHGEVWNDIVTLRCGLVSRYGHRVDRGREARNLDRIVTCFGPDKTRLYCSIADGQVVGFSLFVVWKGTWYAAYTGTMAAPVTRFAYFDHLFYMPLGDAAAEGAHMLDFGVGAWQAKRARGCELAAADVWGIGLDHRIDRSIELAQAAMVPEEGAATGDTAPGAEQAVGDLIA